MSYPLCKSCGAGMARSIQVRRGTLMPYPLGMVTCCNPACRIVLDIESGKQYKNGKLTDEIYSEIQWFDPGNQQS